MELRYRLFVVRQCACILEVVPLDFGSESLTVLQAFTWSLGRNELVGNTVGYNPGFAVPCNDCCTPSSHLTLWKVRTLLIFLGERCLWVNMFKNKSSVPKRINKILKYLVEVIHSGLSLKWKQFPLRSSSPVALPAESSTDFLRSLTQDSSRSVPAVPPVSPHIF